MLPKVVLPFGIATWCLATGDEGRAKRAKGDFLPELLGVAC
jgi:hypothetical protein